MCENPTPAEAGLAASSAARKASYDSQGNLELKDEESSGGDSDVDVTGLGDDTKLPFQVRLLTEASKQNFQSHKFMSSNLEAAYSHFRKSKSAQSFGQPRPFSLEQKTFFGLSDYMYMDKANAIQVKSNEIQKGQGGFSIDEIMKR